MSEHAIDYGMGTANIDRETGIRYGVISQHSISPDALEGFEADYGKPTCDKCGNDLVEYSEEKHGWYPYNGCCNYACEYCERSVDSEDAYWDELLYHILINGEYTAVLHNDGDIVILASLYYTHAQFCSPCMPGACHLDHPVDSSGPMTYCFGHDFFEDGKAPYPVYRVSDGTLVSE